MEKYDVVFTNKIMDKIENWRGSIVPCAGTGSRKLAKTIDDDLAQHIVKGYSMTIINNPERPWVSLLDDEAKIVTARLGKDRLRVAGTAEFNGYNTDIVQARIRLNTLGRKNVLKE